ncbi:MAG: hypothetical protein ABFS34_02600 [Gemmatimonadota bacterium]
MLAIPTSGAGQQAGGRAGPVRTERFAMTAAAGPLELEVDAGSGGDEGRSTALIAGAALAAGALGWLVGAYAGGSMTESSGDDDLAVLTGIVVGGAAVSIPASALAPHYASGRKGDLWWSILAGYGVSAIAIAAWNEGGWVLGPALAIPIAIAIET